MQNTVTKAVTSFWPIVFPLALAQFVCSYAATTMNVSITSIATDLGTDVHAIQITITFFTLTMAALMIPGSKLSDIWGRKFCLMLGLMVYGVGALIATFAQGIGTLTFGYSLLEGVGTALLIPPVYILCTVSFLDLPTRARAFGIISAAGGIGAAAGPLIGGIITTAISWRASFILQVLIVALIFVLSRRIADPGVQGARPKFDFIGTILSAAGLVFVVLGILQSGTYGWVTASQNFTIGTTVVIPAGRHLTGLAVRRHRRPLFSGVLRVDPIPRTGRQRAALITRACSAIVPLTGVSDTAHPMVHHAGQLLRDLGLPARGARI